MTYIDVTNDFRDLIEAKRSSTPPSSRSKSPLGSRSASRSRKGKDRTSGDVLDQEEFLKEAYRIHNHLAALGTLLKTVRKPYLSLQEPPPLSRRRLETQSSGGDGDDEDRLKRWSTSKYLTERERDEIDLRGKMILRRCRERVGVLEDGEKARHNKVAPPPNKIFTFLPSLMPTSDDSSEPLLVAHRASILWTLNSLLARTTQELAGLQEERSKRRQERGRTLGEGASKEAAHLSNGSSSSKSFWNSTTQPKNGSTVPTAIIPEDEIPIESQLSKEQLQQFESENNALLDHMSSQLDSVLSAEKSLLEISALQTELVKHLVQQTEMVEKLYDEAVGSVGEIGAANTQLKKAKERGGEARFFLLMFLIGASLALLFLDWYS